MNNTFCGYIFTEKKCYPTVQTSPSLGTFISTERIAIGYLFNGSASTRQLFASLFCCSSSDIGPEFSRHQPISGTTHKFIFCHSFTWISMGAFDLCVPEPVGWRGGEAKPNAAIFRQGAEGFSSKWNDSHCLSESKQGQVSPRGVVSLV